MTLTINEVAEQLLANKVGIFPADTIYGLTCLPTKEAIEALYVIKQRQKNHPFLMILPGLEAVKKWVDPLTVEQETTLKRYWPGPFTFILNKKATVNDLITAGKPTIAIRVPDFQPVMKLLETVKQPLLSTSVNVSGQASITDLTCLDDQFRKKIDFCFDSISPLYGVESTLVDLTVNPFKVIRQGVKTFE